MKRNETNLISYCELRFRKQNSAKCIQAKKTCKLIENTKTCVVAMTSFVSIWNKIQRTHALTLTEMKTPSVSVNIFGEKPCYAYFIF